MSLSTSTPQDSYVLQPLSRSFTETPPVDIMPSEPHSSTTLLDPVTDDEGLEGPFAPLKDEKRLLLKLGLSFFLFGLLNNVLYVVVLSAALDLVPPSTPKGVVAFCNIAPALVAKVGWPYVLKGKIRYARRIIGCCFLSVAGMFVVSSYEHLNARLLGIGLASFSSGLGEMTFLQLSTTYIPPSIGGHSVGYFASGTGAAGLVGAFFWWEVRGLGVHTGIIISSVLPFLIPATYFYLLPGPEKFHHHTASYAGRSSLYTHILSSESGEDEEGSNFLLDVPKLGNSLTFSDKWRLVRPLLFKYMFPLFCVYLFEYTINQGVSPTLLYPVPPAERYSFLSKIIHSVRDYYPLWQLVYQTTVFISRSTISLGLPPLPERLLSVPAIAQFFILNLLAFESAVGIFSEASEGLSIAFVFLLISIEGICGGLAYVNVFYRINQEPDTSLVHDPERTKQEREFKIGSIGFSDSTGILFASLLAVPVEMELCKAQVRRGKVLCKGL
ncbi:hypothetical protein SERLA73DRAFT_179291 [Serpula lacrymans var. lacrymans S7.3]|uniref:Protein BTN n=2 Tax=Serpula lacrymans var. lacrymans TaxID=341189 RepID=F8PRV1_SERL3|nr:uncharacterized protein SERLADRAFT_464346 [Serpula lacrymans var. lacrymans S7.9]EGO01186.1 hypothetical protein SERLA73DRAFT_179291 [Serpula lacrymans var. lacrymans S7.3]EGO26834.1 hypothetical protein SERLADRAFT_464346 [Serpula lacrymans var. lacrymans S7.9]